MFKEILFSVHVVYVLARNFELPGSWADEDEPAPNIDDYHVSDDLETYDDLDHSKTSHIENVTSSINVTNVFEFIRELRNITRLAGDTVKLICEIKSDHTPVDILWFKNDVPIRKKSSRIAIKHNDRKNKKTYISRLHIMKLDVHDSGFYKCVATNNERQLKSSTGVLNVKPNQGRLVNSHQDHLEQEPPIPNFESILKSSNIKFVNSNFNMGDITAPVFGHEVPICERYRGTECKQFLGGEEVFIRPNVSQIIIDKKLMAAFNVISLSDDLSKLCATYARPALCYSALPICKSTHPPIPDLICRQDCELLENDICKREYAIAKRHPIIGDVLNFEDCSKLPLTDCRSLGLPVPEPAVRTEYCYRYDGKDYRGVVSKTGSGKDCIPWNQSNIRTPNYTEILGGHNYCRNPDHSAHEPWCYTYDNNMSVKESCNIPKCEDTTDTRVQAVLLGLVAILTLLTVLCCYFCCSRRRNRRQKREQMLPSNKLKMSPGKTSIIKVNSSSNGSLSGSRREISSLIPNSGASSQKSERRQIKVVEFNFNSIQFEEELGEGAFGKVYRGEVRTANGERMLVAIKTLKENANSKTVSEFKREVELMSELRHPNIISLLGVCTTSRLCMLFEYMSHGDLHEYLIAHSPNQDVPRNYTDGILEQEDLLNIAIQIAGGMEYLCSQHFVHRDLATRNCLVGDNLVVKISDFGLSRDVYSSDYYRVQKSALLPIRWMSPESILYGKFTVESDIWSYGVVLWEIYSYGLQPYYAHNNQDVVDMIRSHQVLSSPEGCPSRMYALMIECWNQVPSRRPQFGEIHSRLVQWRDTCSSSDKTDSTQLSHLPPHKQHSVHPFMHTHLVAVNMPK